MAGITGLGNTFNLPNYHGELIRLTPTETPLLSMAGGLSGGGMQTDNKSFEWQGEDLRDPSIRGRLEGAAAPTAEARVRQNYTNVVQIFHETVETSYTKQATAGAYATTSAGAGNPVIDEHAHQVGNALTSIARDINWAMWNGAKTVPADNTAARLMGGMIEAAGTTNVVSGSGAITGDAATDTITTDAAHGAAVGDKIVFTDVGGVTTLVAGRTYWVVTVGSTTTMKIAATKGGTAITIGTATDMAGYMVDAASALTVDLVEGLCQNVWDKGGLSDQGTATIFCNSGVKRAISKVYAAAYRQADPVRQSVGGVTVNVLETDFGVFNVVIDRALPADALFVASMAQVSPVFLNIPGKGVLFEEELAKVGSSERSQIYGEVGLKYGNPNAHGVLRGIYA